jgi:hypothetical protein
MISKKFIVFIFAMATSLGTLSPGVTPALAGEQDMSIESLSQIFKLVTEIAKSAGEAAKVAEAAKTTEASQSRAMKENRSVSVKRAVVKPK